MQRPKPDFLRYKTESEHKVSRQVMAELAHNQLKKITNNCKSGKDLTLAEKKKILTKVRVKLKKHYRGIDEQIDMLIDSISGWYLGTTVGDRPTIVNIWSITGLGKTSLVRMLMDELQAANRLVEITLDNSASQDDHMTVLRRVSRAVGNNRNNLCLFIDEFQNMQTIDKEGKPVRNTPYQDLWTLLSDGRFFTKEDFLEIIINLFDLVCGYWISAHKNLQLALDQCGKLDENTKLKPEIELWRSRSSSFESNYDHHLGAYDRNLIEVAGKFDDMLYSVGYSKDYELEDIEKFVKKLSEELRETNIYTIFRVNMSYEKDRVIKALNSSLFQHLDFLTFNRIIDSVKKEAVRLVKSDVESLLRAQNLLVIIAGNQDSLFNGSRSLMCTYKDIDEMYEANKKLKWFDLKQLLLENIRPEQISRLGMNHIIYPTLSTKAYKQLINDRLKIIAKRVYKNYKINLTFTDNLKSILFRNGAFPTQGVRPLLSLVDVMVGGSVIELCSQMKPGKVNVDIDEKTKKLILTHGKKKTTKNLLLEVSDREEDCGGKGRLANAVHEAGHAITWMFLTGLPADIDMAPLSMEAAAFTRPLMNDDFSDESESLHRFHKSYISMALGGRVAETLVFGEENLSHGCWGDLQMATHRALNLVRKYGYATQTNNGVLSFVNNNDYYASKLLTIDDDNLQREAIMVLNECRYQTEDILTLCKPVLIDMVEYLMKNVFLGEDEAKRYLRLIGELRKSIGFVALKDYKSEKMWKRFAK